MSQLTEAIRDCADDVGAQALADVNRWTRDQPVLLALIPSLVEAVLVRQNRVHPSGGDRKLTAVQLCGLLTEIDRTQLARFRAGQQERPVSTASFSAFRTTGRPPADVPIQLLFLMHLSDELLAGRFADNERVQALLSVCNPITLIERRFRSNDNLPQFQACSPATPLLHAHEPPPGTTDLLDAENEVIRRLSTLLSLGSVAASSVHQDFFRASDKKAHFLVYRRAMRTDRIIIGFLVIDPPRVDGGEAYTFKHFHRNTAGDFRETHGFVLTLRRAHYFLGGTGSAQFHSNPDDADKPRVRLSEALKLIAVPERVNDDVWGGLFLSHGPNFDPIAGRCVFVRTDVHTYQGAGIGDCSVDELDAHLEKFAVETLLSNESLKDRLAAGIKAAINNSSEPFNAENLAGPLTVLSPLTS